LKRILKPDFLGAAKSVKFHNNVVKLDNYQYNWWQSVPANQWI